jgi:hypothetical protein
MFSSQAPTLPFPRVSIMKLLKDYLAKNFKGTKASNFKEMLNLFAGNTVNV